MDLEALRDDFPILSSKVRGRPLVYLDSAATSHKPRQVIDAMAGFYEKGNANIHRGMHALAEEATERYEAVRRKVLAFCNAGSSYEVVFTKNATEAINLVASSLDSVRKGDVVSTMIEHHANFVPWQQHAERNGAAFRILPLGPSGFERHDEMITDATALAAATMASNVTGETPNYRDVLRAAKRHGALTLLDAAQAAPHMLVDLEEDRPDFVAFSAHKMLGPTGLGVLIAKKRLLEGMRPFLYGGEMISTVAVEGTTFAPPPQRFEAGTMPIAQVIGLDAALGYLKAIGRARLAAHEKDLGKTFRDTLPAEDVVELGKTSGPRLPIFSLATPHAHPHDLATILDSKGIAVRAGHHCAMPFLTWKGIPGTTRASAYLYNTEEEIKTFAGAYRKAVGVFFRG